MRKRAHSLGALSEHGEHLLHVDARRSEQRLAHRLAVERVNGGQKLLGALPLHAHLARERVAIGVQTRRRKSDEHIALAHAFGIEHLRTIDHAHREAGQVVIVRVHNTRMLSHLAADERAARLAAALADARHDFRHMLAAQLADRDVVQEEQRLGAAGEDVVHAHGDKVDAHRAMLADKLGHLELGAHAIGTRHEQRVFHPLRRRDGEQAAEAADVAHDLGAIG